MHRRMRNRIESHDAGVQPGSVIRSVQGRRKKLFGRWKVQRYPEDTARSNRDVEKCT